MDIWQREYHLEKIRDKVVTTPLTVSPRTIMLGPGETFSKYDVLAEPPIAGVTTEYSLHKHRAHVGNQRFQVLLAMNKGSYEKARMQGDGEECNRLVDQLVDTVCKQVVPRGRFLESTLSVGTGSATPEHQWSDMDESTVKSLLHKELSSAADQLPGNQNDLSSIGSGPTTSESDTQNDLNAHHHPRIASPLTLSPDLDDDGQKRRRRSSLLRRSNSESILETFLDNRKKLNLNAFDPRGNTQEEPTSWKTVTTAGELNRMDVVFSAERDALDPSCMSVGNNRLHILSAVRAAPFKEGSPEAQEKILDEMIETVSTFWKGRFHVEIPGGYDELSNGEAREIIRIILSGKKNVTQARRQRHSDPTDGLAGFLATPQGAGFGKETTSAHHLFASSLPSGLMNDAQKNQNRALLDLKKQKARNQNASRLKEKLGVTTKKQQVSEGYASSAPTQEQALFPLGGMVQPSMFGAQGNLATFNNNMYGYQMDGSHSSSFPRPSASRSSYKPRQSTVFGGVEAKMMEELAAELGDSDDDFDGPLPPSIPSSTSNRDGGGSHPNPDIHPSDVFGRKNFYDSGNFS